MPPDAAAAKLLLVCGKAASGKSSLSASLAETHGALLLAEDDWLAALFGDQLRTLADFKRCSDKLRAAVAPHVVDLLRAGQSVVLDFQANTVDSRAWMRGIAETAGVVAELHYLDVDDETCKARLRARNAAGDHPFALSEDQFDRLATHFTAPTACEGLEIIRH